MAEFLMLESEDTKWLGKMSKGEMIAKKVTIALLSVVQRSLIVLGLVDEDRSFPGLDRQLFESRKAKGK